MNPSKDLLTSRIRVARALAHQEPDRVPVDFWATGEVKRVLKRHLGFETEEELLNYLDVDFRVLSGPVCHRPPAPEAGEGISTDIWGVQRKTVTFGNGDHQGSYQELARSPLEAMESVEAIDRYTGWPSPDWWDYNSLAEDCRRVGDKCVVFVGDRMDRTAQLKPAMYLRGVEQIMLDMALNPEIVDGIVEHITEYYLEYNRRVFEAARGGIDIFMMGDDFGTQTGPMMSVEMWERFFEKGFRQYIALAHSYGMKVMHHTCGSVRPLIPKFIDAGLDILQSLQPRAANMDLGELKKEFGADLCFHGSMDIQETMPRGVPDDIRAEVCQRMRVGKPGGGFIICTAHNIQPDTPVENILALFDAYKEYAAYE
ncbi:MAG: methylcobalamin:coenzyme M methyltransferase [bacterium ADurb.Bin429]|nr:MAG: methylcobalamin:coenzyme M methyltransferase [bacterium ADurb.Bin429]